MDYRLNEKEAMEVFARSPPYRLYAEDSDEVL